MNYLKMAKALFTSAPSLPPGDCFERIRSGAAVLIDVREPDEWASGVAEHAVRLALSDLSDARKDWKPFLAANAQRELLVYCAAGGRSAIAARLLVQEGFRAANTGGLRDWVAAGWPVVNGPATSR
ncbi:MAG: rhodanese-like domain-containing protein [Verrucomicrobiota bacterium]|jgi:rhodanese-related sulfurtransferase